MKSFKEFICEEGAGGIKMGKAIIHLAGIKPTLIKQGLLVVYPISANKFGAMLVPKDIEKVEGTPQEVSDWIESKTQR